MEKTESEADIRQRCCREARQQVRGGVERAGADLPLLATWPTTEAQDGRTDTTCRKGPDAELTLTNTDSGVTTSV